MQIDPARRRLSLDPSEPAFVQDPYPAYAQARAAGPALFWEQYGHWCLFDHAGVSAGLRDRRLGREALPDSPAIPAHLEPFYAVDHLAMLDREPPAHTRLRALVSRAFVSRQIERLRPEITFLAHRLIDGFAPLGRTELLEHFATPIPLTIIATLLGIPLDDGGRLLDWSHRMVAMYRLGRTRADEDAAVAATDAFVAYLRALVAARRLAPGDDLITRLIVARESGDRLSEDELIANCILLLNAGHEATVHAIGNGVRTILQSGRDPDTLFGTEAANEATVEELLRIDTPLHMFTRIATEEIEIRGVTLRRGERIGLMLGAANRDPAAYPEPDAFIPGRSGPAHTAFGAGIHFCLGAPLARLELQTALPALFARLPAMRAASVPAFADTYHFRGLARLELAWESPG